MGLGVDVKMHARIIPEGGLVDIDIQPLGCLHLEGGLDSRVREEGLGTVAADSAAETAANFAQMALRVLILLGIIVSGNPPCKSILSHCELGQLLLDDKIGKRLGIRELIPESETVVKEAETYVHLPPRFALGKEDQQFVVMVTYMGFLSQYRLPGLVETVESHAVDNKTLIEEIAGLRVLLDWHLPFEIDPVGSYSSPELETKTSWKQDYVLTVGESIAWNSTLCKLELGRKLSRRRTEIV